MSHGSSDSGTIEPNLTPLLDLVLQLLMLFMICGNYASESNDPVDLARSTTAKQMADEGDDAATPDKDKKDKDFLFITVKPYHNADGVKALADQEIDNRVKAGTMNVEVAGRKHKVVADLYDKLIKKEALDDEERSVLFELGITADSEADLAEHVQESVRKNLLQTFKDGDAYVLVPGEDAMKPDENLQLWLQKQYKLLSDKQGGEVKTAVVIRPDGNMDYAIIYRILKLCKDARFTNLKVRALIQKGIDG